MEHFACYGKTIQGFCSVSSLKMACLCRSTMFLLVSFYRYTRFILNPFSIQLLYFLALSAVGFLLLRGSDPKKESFRPRNLDLFFTSVSATTVSSMSTVEMEVFSNTQLVFMSILMFMGGEVFASMVGLHLGRFKLRSLRKNQIKIESVTIESLPSNFLYQIELGMVTKPEPENAKPEVQLPSQVDSIDREYLKYKSIKFLSFVVLGYLLVIHVIGLSLVLLYFTIVSSARNVLRYKGLKLFTFSVFTVISTFAGCGFIPTNENMSVFRKNSGLLFILIPQVLLGNTLFPSFLRLSVWLFGKFVKKSESKFLLNNSEEIGYLHFLPSLHSWLLVCTVLGFILVQFTLFCSMDWNSAALDGMSSYEKVVGIIFQTVNTRHTGESIVDISTISQAVLVLFVIMMYFPPYTSFLPIKDHDEEFAQECERKRKRRAKVVVSQLSYLAIFTILICMTERKRMKDDPLNFNVMNIVFEVVSAYGNVGFSTGYSCARQLHPDDRCQDKLFGFSGKWSDEGKLILILVMFFGRLRKFNMDGGRAWKLL